MVDFFTQFGAEKTGIAALGLNFTSFLIQLGTFIIALIILKKWAFKPMLKVLKERRDTIEQGVKLGEKMKAEEAAMEEKVSKSLNQARVEADGIIADASERGRGMISDAEAKAKQKSEAIIASAEETAKQDIARARRQLETELVSLVSEATEIVVDEKIDAKKDSALIDRALKGADK